MFTETVGKAVLELLFSAGSVEGTNSGQSLGSTRATREGEERIFIYLFIIICLRGGTATTVSGWTALVSASS